MKHIKFALFFFVILSACACNSGITEDMAKYGLNCKVKELNVSASSGELDYVVDFNSKGMVEHILCTDQEGSMLHEEFHKFDGKGRLTEIQDLDEDGVTEGRYAYEYDGKFVSKCCFYGMNNEEIHRWEHKNDGKNIVKTEYYNNGILEYVTTKEFDGNVCHERSVSAEGSVIGDAVTTYFSDNKPSSIKGDNVDIQIEYNEKGLPVKSVGTMISSGGEFGWQPELESSPERFYKYEYDNKGNWVTRTEHRHPDSLAVVTVSRKIIY